MDNGLAEIKVIVARIDERQAALAVRIERLFTASADYVTRRECDANCARLREVEKSQQWIMRGAAFGSAAVVAGLGALLRKIGVI